MKRIYSFLLGLVVIVGLLSFSTEAQAQYCKPQLMPGFWGQGITFFAFGSFSRSSPGTDYANQSGYEYYTGATLQAARNTRSSPSDSNKCLWSKGVFGMD
ncbi:MAG: hypothetical protein IPF79_13645 [Ignavibacteria bacterium]|nr:hypothetical protein [Ignavibacteria bacterium]